MATLRAELGGSGWSLNVQRWRATPIPPLSSNLGVATLALIDRRESVLRVVVRLMDGERFWISVTAPRGVAVSGLLADGRALEDEQFTEPLADPVLHRLARVVGEGSDGIGREHIPVFRRIDASGYSVAVTVGDLARLHLRAIEAPDFDAHFGPPARGGDQPTVYGGWRLP